MKRGLPGFKIYNKLVYFTDYKWQNVRLIPKSFFLFDAYILDLYLIMLLCVTDAVLVFLKLTLNRIHTLL